MNANELVILLLKGSIFLMVLALGLRSSVDDALYLFRRPEQLLRSLLAMDVIMPLVAVILALAFDLLPAVRVAIVALAVSPVPPLLPRKQLKAGGASSYVVGLLFAAALLAIVLVPVLVDVIARIFGREVHVGSSRIAAVMALSVLVPLVVGVLVRAVAPGFAQRIAGPVASLATVLVVIGLIPLLVVALPTSMHLIGNGTLLAIVMFAVAGLAAGHLLGGPERQTRSVLALATEARHPGVALAIGAVVFPDGQKLVLAAVLLYVLVAAILAIPYIQWQKRHLAVPGGAAA
jgi:BASS family bile acid:Na+ symporter